METVVEMLQYTLQPGSGAIFHSVMVDESFPLHHLLGVQVLAFGNSIHDADNYYLLRSFQNVSEMDLQLAQLYSDPRWKKGPRNAIISMILESHRVVFPSDTANFLLPKISSASLLPR